MNIYPKVWHLPCSATPFLNRDHPIFLAIEDQVVDATETRIKLEHLGWVMPQTCCTEKQQAEEELWYFYEQLWLLGGDDKLVGMLPPRNTLNSYLVHAGHQPVALPWFDMYTTIHGETDAKTKRHRSGKTGSVGSRNHQVGR